MSADEPNNIRSARAVYSWNYPRRAACAALGAARHCPARWGAARTVPADGLLILRDGEPGEPEVTLSPLAYHYQHRVEIEAVVQGADRDAAFDALNAGIGASLTADRTLVDACPACR